MGKDFMEMYAILTFIYVFTLGLFWGSFLNVVAVRYNTGTSFLKGRSFCFVCGKTLHWYELIPVLSFLAQKGKCRKCKSKISIQYMLAELLTGIIFLLIFLKALPLFTTLLFAAIWSALIVITIYDARHKIIPDGVVYAFIGLSAVSLVATWISGTVINIWDILAGPLLALPFAGMWYLSKGTWMGFGDAKLALGIGWFLGLSGGAAAVMLAFWSGAIVGLVLMGISRISSLVKRSKRFTMKSEIPFGPFLVLGTAIAFFGNVDFETLLQLFIW